jgi:hypothetical protein
MMICLIMRKKSNNGCARWFARKKSPAARSVDRGTAGPSIQKDAVG